MKDVERDIHCVDGIRNSELRNSDVLLCGGGNANTHVGKILFSVYNITILYCIQCHTNR
jgi:hypothetical protein